MRRWKFIIWAKWPCWFQASLIVNASLACDQHGPFACASVSTYIVILRSPWIIVYLRLLESKYDGIMLFRNLGTCNPNNILSHPRRLASPATLQQELHIYEFTTILKVESYKVLDTFFIKYLLLTCSVTLTVYWLYLISQLSKIIISIPVSFISHLSI